MKWNAPVFKLTYQNIYRDKQYRVETILATHQIWPDDHQVHQVQSGCGYVSCVTSPADRTANSNICNLSSIGLDGYWYWASVNTWQYLHSLIDTHFSIGVDTSNPVICLLISILLHQCFILLYILRNQCLHCWWQRLGCGSASTQPRTVTTYMY